MAFCGDLNVYSYGNDYEIIKQNYDLYDIKDCHFNNWNLKHFDIEELRCNNCKKVSEHYSFSFFPFRILASLVPLW